MVHITQPQVHGVVVVVQVDIHLVVNMMKVQIMQQLQHTNVALVVTGQQVAVALVVIIIIHQQIIINALMRTTTLHLQVIRQVALGITTHTTRERCTTITQGNVEVAHQPFQRVQVHTIQVIIGTQHTEH